MTISEAYKILEIDSPDYTLLQVKTAFRGLAKKYHPDITGKSDTHKFIEINTAYVILINYINSLGKINHEEKERIVVEQSDFILEEFIEMIKQYHNYYFILPISTGNVVPSSKSDEFYKLLNELFDEKVLNFLSNIKSDKLHQLVDLLFKIMTSYKLKYRKELFNKLKAIAKNDPSLSKKIAGSVYGIPTKLSGLFSNSSNTYQDPRSYENKTESKNEDKNKFIYNSQLVDKFIVSFVQQYNKQYDDNYYDRAGFTLRDSFKLGRNHDAGRLLFKNIKRKLNKIGFKIKSEDKDILQEICISLAVISNLSDKFDRGFIQRFSYDFGFSDIFLKFIVEDKLTLKEIEIIFALFSFYLPNKKEHLDLIDPSIKYNEYAKILNEMFFIYQIACINNYKITII